jgi:hypothetical protein
MPKRVGAPGDVTRIMFFEAAITFGSYRVLERVEVAHDETVDLEPIVHLVRSLGRRNWRASGVSTT